MIFKGSTLEEDKAALDVELQHSGLTVLPMISMVQRKVRAFRAWGNSKRRRGIPWRVPFTRRNVAGDSPSLSRCPGFFQTHREVVTAKLPNSCSGPNRIMKHGAADYQTFGNNQLFNKHHQQF